MISSWRQHPGSGLDILVKGTRKRHPIPSLLVSLKSQVGP